MMNGSTVWLAVANADGDEMEAWVKMMPASSSPQYGIPFLRALQKAGGFYNLDPGLFAPAEISITTLRDGRVCHAGHRNEAALSS